MSCLYAQQDEGSTSTIPQPVSQPEKSKQKGFDGNTLEESPSIDVPIVTSHVTVQPDLSSTLTQTTPEATAPVVGPSAWPGWSGNGAGDALCICSPQPTSGPPPSALENRSAGSSLVQYKKRDGNNGQQNKGVPPPPSVVQWMQCFFWAIELAWLIIPQTVGWCMSRCHRDVECNGCCKKHCKQPSSDANQEPDDQDEIKHVGEGFKHIFSLVSKLMQSFGTPRCSGPPSPGPPPCN